MCVEKIHFIESSIGVVDLLCPTAHKHAFALRCNTQNCRVQFSSAGIGIKSQFDLSARLHDHQIHHKDDVVFLLFGRLIGRHRCVDRRKKKKKIKRRRSKRHALLEFLRPTTQCKFGKKATFFLLLDFFPSLFPLLFSLQMSTKRVGDNDDDAQRKLAKKDDLIDHLKNCNECGEKSFALTPCYCGEDLFCEQCKDDKVFVCTCGTPACESCNDTGAECPSCEGDGTNAWVCKDCMAICVECCNSFCEAHIEAPCCVCGGQTCSACKEANELSKCNGCEGVMCSDCKSSCAQCGTSVCQAFAEDYIPQHCEACHKLICDTCFSDTFTCAFHESIICHACSQMCTACDEFFCRNAVLECVKCNATVCLECADRKGRCGLCKRGLCSDCTLQYETCRLCTKQVCADCTLQCTACAKSRCAECCYICELCQQPVCLECDCECFDCSLKTYERTRCEKCCDTVNKRVATDSK